MRHGTTPLPGAAYIKYEWAEKKFLKHAFTGIKQITMKNHIRTFISLIILTASISCIAQKKDTVIISPDQLVLKNLKIGKSAYIVYNKKTKSSPSERITLVKINVEKKLINDKPVITISQQWDMDTIVHSAYTVLNATDLSTLEHDYYWKRLGYSTKFNFETKEISYEGDVTDSVKSTSMKDFNESFSKYNLNWHSDLVIFSLLPFKDNRTFKINFYDPGFGKAEEVFYTVIDKDLLTNSSGEQIKCWVMEKKLTSAEGYQKFWISQKTGEILKEEDSFNGRLRYKLKVFITENNQ